MPLCKSINYKAMDIDRNANSMRQNTRMDCGDAMLTRDIILKK